jgi:hypothetical protein
MLPRACLILATALAAGPLVARQPQPVELKPRWQAGDSARYEMTRTLVRQADGKVVRKATSHTAVEVEVIEADNEGSVIRWTQGSTVFDDPKAEEPLDRATGTIQKLVDIDLDLDADGALEGVRNWKDLRASGHKVQDAVLAQMAKAGAPKSALESLRKETDKFFASKESVERAFASQSSLLFLPFGREYDLGTPVAFEGELPNPYGGDEALPAQGEFTLKSMSAQDGVAVIVFKQSLDPKEAPRALRKWLDESAKQAGKPAPREAPELQIDEVTEYEFDATTGWVRSVTRTRRVKEASRSETETVTLTRKAK